jgi:hypothetical protein
MRLSEQERTSCRDAGWVAPSIRLPEDLIAPARDLARRLASRKLAQDFLSGIHNPFGRNVCGDRAWAFLDIAESACVLDLVEEVLGQDIVLWDSELYFRLSALSFEEAEWWPVDPLKGMITIVSLACGSLALADITRWNEVGPSVPVDEGVLYVLRYMPATSHFNRDARFASNRRATLARPLVNYPKRPIWLVRGEDRANNDYSVGFASPVAQWAPARGVAKIGGPI